MSWLTAFYLTNTASGVLLAFLGWLAAVRPHRYIPYCLPLFLLAFGTQFVASNSAGAAHAPATAYVLYYLSASLGPLQAAMLLGHVEEESEGHPTVRRIARHAATLAFLCCVTGAVLAILHPSSVLVLQQLESGYYTAEFGWARAFFHVAQFTGVALAVLLLACITSTSDPRSWRLHAGLAVAIAWSYGWTLGTEIQYPDSGSLLVALIVALTLLLGAGAALVMRAHHALEPRLRLQGLAVLAACILAPLAGLPDYLPLWYFGTPGLLRLLAATFLIAPALVPTDWRRHLAQARNWPHLTVALFVLATATVGALGHLGVDLPGAWRLLAVATSSAALVGAGVLSIVPGIQVLRDRLPIKSAEAV